MAGFMGRHCTVPFVVPPSGANSLTAPSNFSSSRLQCTIHAPRVGRDSTMRYDELVESIQQLGKDPARLIFEDELTGIPNRRFLLNYFDSRIRWDALDIAPISLLMIDVDYFKTINDTYGHDTGDQALVHIARLLKDVAGEQSIPVRYAGDEFMILTSGQKDDASVLAETLLERLQAESLQLAGGGQLPLTLSIGVATAPENAKNGKELVQKADTALYQAKRAGRNRVVHVSDADPGEVSDKVVLQQLGGGTICTRQDQVAEVRQAIQRFDQGQGQVILVEGATGMGKTTFLETVRRLLQGQGEEQGVGQGHGARTSGGAGVGVDAYVVRTAGSKEEDYRPYYLMTNVLIDLLGRREDKGEAAYSRLTKVEVSFLGALLPQLEGPKELRLAPDHVMRREGIFSAVSKFLYLLLDYRPLALLVDDLNYADEASLTLLKRLLAQYDVPFLLCGTTGPAMSDDASPEAPLAKWLADRSFEEPIAQISLGPLTPADIAAHLRSIFPSLSVPPNTEGILARVTQGSPQFLNELLRKFVVERKLKAVGDRWVLDSFEEQDLPQTLDELLKQKINALDAEGRNLLAQTSVLGENVSLSVLTGSADAPETKVQEFVDQASALGLLSADYQVNDEKIRFAGKKVLDVAYNAIGEATKKALHEKVGTYQETLFKKRLLPSAAPVAHHFARSNNSQKAATYTRMVATDNSALFNAQEMAAYKSEEPASMETPLDPMSLSFVPAVVRSLQTAVRNRARYAPGDKNVVSPSREFIQTVQQVLANNERLNIIETRRSLLVNGQRVNDVSEYKFVAEPFRAFLDAVALRGMTFVRGVTEEELVGLLDGLAQAKPEQIDEQFWSRYAADRGLTHVTLKQTAGPPKVVAVEPESAEPAAQGETSVSVASEEPVGMAEAADEPTAEITRPLPPIVEAGPSQPVPTRPQSRPAPEAESLAAQPLDTLLPGLSDTVMTLLLGRNAEALGTLFNRLVQEMGTREPVVRGKVWDAMKDAIARVPAGFHQDLARQAVEPLFRALGAEQDPKAVGDIARTIYQLAMAVIPFADYPLAIRLLVGLTTTLRSFEEAHDARAVAVAAVLERRVEPAVHKLLVEDLKSADPARHTQAAQLLGGFGAGAQPALIEIVKREAEFRVRQLAASLLAQIGAPAAVAYKKELVLEIAPDERIRMLEVAETVTRVLRTEVAFALADNHAGVREAAYGLIERLADVRLGSLLVDYVGHETLEVAVGAIKCLGKLKPPGAVNVLTGLLESAKDPMRQAAACQALGSLADPAAIDPLTQILVPKGLLRKGGNADVRAAAAYALKQIDDPRAVKILAGLVNDSDARIKHVAQIAAKK